MAQTAQANPLPEQLSPDQFAPVDPQKASIGQLLFYDKILSGNRNISCGTCHHHDYGSADGLSLGIGEGGVGIGLARTAGTGQSRIQRRMARNAPGLWNIGHDSLRTLFHDGRLSTEANTLGFASPAGAQLPEGLDSLAAAQSLFPMAAPFEMAGNSGENRIADAANVQSSPAWPRIARRVGDIPEYADMFTQAFASITRSEDITIVHIANALGAFMQAEWQSMDSPFDTFQRDQRPLPSNAQRGMTLFFGPANCASCHAGPLFTDQQFYALGLPAFGPGRTRAFDPIARDVGRMGASDAVQDAYRFKTPPLRNVELTAPYGHNGAFPTLEGIIHHHADPATSRANWRRSDANLPVAPWLAATDFIIQSDRQEMARQARALDITPRPISEADIEDLTAFLKSLTGASRNTRPMGRPDAVPSGLAVD